MQIFFLTFLTVSSAICYLAVIYFFALLGAAFLGSVRVVQDLAAQTGATIDAVGFIVGGIAGLVLATLICGTLLALIFIANNTRVTKELLENRSR